MAPMTNECRYFMEKNIGNEDVSDILSTTITELRRENEQFSCTIVSVPAVIEGYKYFKLIFDTSDNCTKFMRRFYANYRG